MDGLESGPKLVHVGSDVGLTVDEDTGHQPGDVAHIRWRHAPASYLLRAEAKGVVLADDIRDRQCDRTGEDVRRLEQLGSSVSATVGDGLDGDMLAGRVAAARHLEHGDALGGQPLGQRDGVGETGLRVLRPVFEKIEYCEGQGGGPRQIEVGGQARIGNGVEAGGQVSIVGQHHPRRGTTEALVCGASHEVRAFDQRLLELPAGDDSTHMSGVVEHIGAHGVGVGCPAALSPNAMIRSPGLVVAM